MALDENQNLTEGQNETEENNNPELETETETDDESAGDESQVEESGEEESTSKYDSRLAALEAQLARSNEDRDTLRETLRLNQQLVENTRPQKTQKELTEEQKALKGLGLAFGDDIQGAMEPIVGTVSKLYDQNDAVQFQLNMARTNPDLMKGDAFDKLSTIVEQVRQQYARTTGQYLPRLDAYKYAKGGGMLDQVLPQSTVSKGASDNELKRQQEVKQAGNGVKSSNRQVNASGGSAEIQKIREKAQKGDRLTPQERAKFRAYLADKPF